MPQQTSAALRAWALCIFALLLPGFSAAGTIEGAITTLLHEKGRTADPRQALSPAARSGQSLCLDRQGRLLCWVTLDAQPANTAALSSLPGLEVEGSAGPCVQAWLPLEEVGALAALPGVVQVGLPPRGVPLGEASQMGTAIFSEGLAGMRVGQFASASEGGRGVRIGIIDLGFAGYQSLVGTEIPNKLHTRSFYKNSFGELDLSGEGTIHGTACAELVHDVAPEAELYLANVGSPVDLQNATQWMIDQGVEVISHSVGWFFGSGNGTGLTEDIAASARRQGVLWVNAAGNFAQGHWSGPWRDQNGNGIAELGGEAVESLPLPPVAAGEQVWIVLLWNRWPLSSDLSFEISLVNRSGNLLTSSEEDPYQQGSPYAVRSVSFSSAFARDDLTLRVRSLTGDPSVTRLRLIRGDNGVFRQIDQVAAGSIAMPADAPEVLSVGAYAWDTGELEPFSSRGPTTTGLAKPEILGPDRVSTATYAAEGLFAGTSAACPHVAAAAALLLASSPRGGFFDARWSTDEVLTLLRTNAAPMPDSTAAASGWGQVRLPLLHQQKSGSSLVVVPAQGPGQLHLRLLQAPRTAGPVRVYDVLGRLRGTVEGVPVGTDVLEYRLEDLSPSLVNAGRYWVREGSTSATAAIYWPGLRRVAAH